MQNKQFTWRHIKEFLADASEKELDQFPIISNGPFTEENPKYSLIIGCSKQTVKDGFTLDPGHMFLICIPTDQKCSFCNGSGYYEPFASFRDYRKHNCPKCNS